MAQTRVIIQGVLGRMGREISGIIYRDESLILVGGTEISGHPAIGSDLGEMLGFGKSGVTISASLGDFDCTSAVVIDFTTPSTTIETANFLRSKGAALVIGTTGLESKQEIILKECASDIPILYSPNMSMGVNFLFYLTKIAAEKLGSNFDMEIIEAHHHHKVDSPSGTARKLGEISAEAIGGSYAETVVHGRSGIVGARPKKEIGMHAIRGGDIVGEHTVLFAGIGERIELKHAAHSRMNFASGAVAAAKWLADKKQGFYTMGDLLGF